MQSSASLSARRALRRGLCVGLPARYGNQRAAAGDRALRGGAPQREPRLRACPVSPLRQSKLDGFYADQFRLLDAINFDALSQSGKVDYLLLRARLEREKKQLANDARQDAEIAPLIPFQQTITGLEEARRRMETVRPAGIGGHAPRS